MHQDIPAACDGLGKKFLIGHALSCPKGGLVMARHDDAAKDWGALGSRALVPSAITYEPKINSRTVQGERTGAGIPDPRSSAESAYNTSKEDSRELVDSLLGGSVLNCVGHRAFIVRQLR